MKAGHDEEEECLFFVALSRARDRLFLYASSIQSGDRKRSQSKFIPVIQPLLDRHPNPPQRNRPPSSAADIHITWEEKPVWTDRQISLFERCPRRFLYTHVLRLGGRRTETPFLKMHNVVGDLLDWLKTAYETTNPSDSEVSARFEEAWLSKGAVGHGYEEDYRRIGRRLVDCLIKARSNGVLTPATSISLGWTDCEVLVNPDSVTKSRGGQMVVRRVKTGKPRSDAFDAIEYTILHLAAVQAYGGLAQVEVTFLTSETTEPMSISARKLQTRRQKLENIVQSVRSGDFPPKKEARSCPRCPSFFICGDLPGGALTVKNS